jgi:hypothetical protein
MVHTPSLALDLSGIVAMFNGPSHNSLHSFFTKYLILLVSFDEDDIDKIFFECNYLTIRQI